FSPTRDLFERWVHARDRDVSSKPSVAKAVEFIEDAQGNKGLRISPAAMANLEVQPTEVKLAVEARPLPPQIGHVNFDNDHLFTIRPRFPGELVSFLKVKMDESPYWRDVRFGDRIKQG